MSTRSPRGVGKTWRVIGGRPGVFIACSERFRATVADPLKDALEALGVHAVIATEELRPPGRAWDPETKVDSLLQSSEAFVALLTPDEELAGGGFRCRGNVSEEVGRARIEPRVQKFMIILKSPDVEPWSNINPAYEPLDVEDPTRAIQHVIDQLRSWEIFPAVAAEQRPKQASVVPAEPSRRAKELLAGLELGDHEKAQRRVYRRFLDLARAEQQSLVAEILNLAESTDNNETLPIACSIVEAADRLDPTLVGIEAVERLAGSADFSLRTSAAVLLWQWAEAAPEQVPVALLGRLAQPTEEDWYVQAPATAAAKQLMLRRAEASEIFDRLAESDDAETRYAVVIALLDVARVQAVVNLAERLAADQDASVAEKGAELLRTLRGLNDEDRRRYFGAFGL